MARRRKSRRMAVRGRPNLIWVGTSGQLALVSGNSVWDPLLIPGDWSGTVTEQSATLLRMVVSVYTATISDDQGGPHAQNAAIVMGNANEQGGTNTLDISNWNDWPDFFLAYDRVLHIFRLEWDGQNQRDVNSLPVQFSQLPEPVMNLKTPRAMKPDDTIRLVMGGYYTPFGAEVPLVTWFCRSLVRIGLR